VSVDGKGGFQYQPEYALFDQELEGGSRFERRGRNQVSLKLGAAQVQELDRQIRARFHVLRLAIREFLANDASSTEVRLVFYSRDDAEIFLANHQLAQWFISWRVSERL
jgi:hypothetical protein